MSLQLHEVTISKNNLAQRIERKFYLPPQKVDLAYGLLQHVCRFDWEYPTEQINSLYFDTDDLDQHERSSSGDFKKDKVRIRWYGREKDLHSMQTAFLELKSRKGFASTKQRFKLQVPAEKLSAENLGKGIIPRTMLMDTLASFGYFPLAAIYPVIKISYWRYRFSEVLTGQRVSLDCHIRSTMIIPRPDNRKNNLELPGGVIEVKSTGMELPVTLKNMKILCLDWSRFSKYSSCLDAHDDAPGTIGYLSPSGKIIQF